MRKLISKGLLIFAACCFLCVPVSAETKTVYTTAESGLNIRSMPNTDHERVDCVPYGTALLYVCPTNSEEWSCVSYGGRLRYVHNDYISDTEPEPVYADPYVGASYGSGDFMSAGVIFWGGYRWTWYSERVLPGGGLGIPGRHTDSYGYVRDQDGYLCIASGELAKGTIVPTPFGNVGKVYDFCGTPGTLDVYVNW